MKRKNTKIEAGCNGGNGGCALPKTEKPKETPNPYRIEIKMK
jgi:hypothetical protein